MSSSEQVFGGRSPARRGRRWTAMVAGLLAAPALAVGVAAVPAAGAAPTAVDLPPFPGPVTKQAVAEGVGGAVTSLDPYATAAGLHVLRNGGNAVDAAVATSAMLGVTRPYDGSVGGGGFILIYDAESGEVDTIDARETAPAAMGPEHFIQNGAAIPFPELRVSGLSQGVPGTVRGWEAALDEYGSMELSQLLAPAIQVADEGFVVDEEYVIRTQRNADIFRRFTSSTETFLVNGEVPALGATFQNPEIATTYRILAEEGPDAFYEGPIAEAIAETSQNPPLVDGYAGPPVRDGLMTTADLDAYEAKFREPTMVRYGPNKIFGMGPPSSGGTTVGEALNILQPYDLAELPADQVLHLLIEAEALAFADRNKYLGDPDFVDVPVRGLLSNGYAAERRKLIDEQVAAAKPVPAGDARPGRGKGILAAANHPMVVGSTTHLTTADQWGNVVSMTFTIEQIGGSGIAVPGYGFLLNNELTDFTIDAANPSAPANAPEGGKRPRSSMSPTIVLEPGGSALAYGSPGGATIINTVLLLTVNHYDRGMTLPEAIAAPRLSNTNSSTTAAEPGIPTALLAARGHAFTTPADPIGNANGIHAARDGSFLAAAEPVRFHGGSAGVVTPE